MWYAINHSKLFLALFLLIWQRQNSAENLENFIRISYFCVWFPLKQVFLWDENIGIFNSFLNFIYWARVKKGETIEWRKLFKGGYYTRKNGNHFEGKIFNIKKMKISDNLLVHVLVFFLLGNLLKGHFFSDHRHSPKKTEQKAYAC